MDTLQTTAHTLTTLDWLLLALLLYSTLRAFLRGFLLEFFSLMGMASGIVIAAWHYTNFARHLVTWLQPVYELSLPVANIAAFLAIVIAAVVASSVAGRFLKRTASAIGLGLFDRAAGALFGFARGCLLAVAVAFALTAFSPSSRLIAESQLFPYFLAATHAVSFVVPQSLQHQVKDGTARIKHTKPAWSN